MVQRLAVEHRESTGHQMAVIDGVRASCGSCDFNVHVEGCVVIVSHEDE